MNTHAVKMKESKLPFKARSNVCPSMPALSWCIIMLFLHIPFSALLLVEFICYQFFIVINVIHILTVLMGYSCFPCTPWVYMTQIQMINSLFSLCSMKINTFFIAKRQQLHVFHSINSKILYVLQPRNKQFFLSLQCSDYLILELQVFYIIFQLSSESSY